MKDRVVEDVLRKMKKRNNAINKSRDALATEKTKKIPSDNNNNIVQERMDIITRTNTNTNRKTTNKKSHPNNGNQNQNKLRRRTTLQITKQNDNNLEMIKENINV